MGKEQEGEAQRKDGSRDRMAAGGEEQEEEMRLCVTRDPVGLRQDSVR